MHNNQHRIRYQDALAFAFLICSLWQPVFAGQPLSAAGKMHRAEKASPPGASTREITTYLAPLRDKLMQNWVRADGRNHVILSIKVNADGSTEDLAISSSPKNEAAEKSAQDTFNNVLPLAPLPVSIKTAKIILSFDSTADPHGDNSANLNARLEPLYDSQPPKSTTIAPEKR